ncbi:hypothetical protein HCEG_00449 [Histoplasma capsulatum var. duboisii H88]|uniref:Uncharacterized protein n=1 Tax=Ajellomyces capsulatus (strain H88) TaxID=544711 RepID=F0U9J0_AJEC8|nr:hypothetical protein HCEG_00449 [Histoplasma capsulatum var. duboisii H88]
MLAAYGILAARHTMFTGLGLAKPAMISRLDHRSWLSIQRAKKHEPNIERGR